jgi:hypothetical protein
MPKLRPVKGIRKLTDFWFQVGKVEESKTPEDSTTGILQVCFTL